MSDSPLDDPRVHPDSYVIYPTGYDAMVHGDKFMWVLTVNNGHKDGWYIARGFSKSTDIVMNRKGEWKWHQAMNRSKWRYPLEDALQIALDHVDTHVLNGHTAQQASDRVYALLGSRID